MLLEHHSRKQSRFETVSRTVLEDTAKAPLRLADRLELFVVGKLIEPRLHSGRSVQLLHEPLFGGLESLQGRGLAGTHELTRNACCENCPHRVSGPLAGR